MKKIALIGSTGSIGVQTLNVVRRNPDKFRIVSLAAGNNILALKEQAREFKPLAATAAKRPSYGDVATGAECFYGENAFTEAIIDEADIVVVALVGFKGIIAVLDALKKNKNVALANKESLVVGGALVTEEAKKRGLKIIPIDSEHSAIFQALDFDVTRPFERLILTASGGAFRDYTEKQLSSATAKDALKHPNWNMGAKITVDCATLVNKAFEVTEAKWLYNAPFDKIEVIVHRESIVHSMVGFKDGSVIAQMSYPTMEIPISLALSYPERLVSNVNGLDFEKLGKLTFEPLDRKRFPCFDLVVNAAKAGDGYPAVANGANEAAVSLFLKDKIGYNDIYNAISGALDSYRAEKITDYEGYKTADEFGANFVKNKYGV